MTAQDKPAARRFMPRHVSVAALAIAVQAALATSAALAVVLPEETSIELEHRFDEYVRADGYFEMDAASLVGENWYSRP